MQVSKEEKIIKRVKLMLGGNVVKLEVSDEDIKELIETAIEVVSPHISDTRFITFPFSPFIDLSDENVSEVVRVIPGSMTYSNNLEDSTETDFEWSGYVVDNGGLLSSQSKISLLSKSVQRDYDIPFEFDGESKALMISDGIVSGNVTVEVIPESYTLESIRDARVHKWIYEYTLALTKEVVGRIRSKVKSTNVPIELDGDTLISEAAQEKATLESSLETDQFGPVDIIR